MLRAAAAAPAWRDVDPVELARRVSDLTSWIRGQEADRTATEPPTSERMARLATALGVNRVGAAR